MRLHEKLRSLREKQEPKLSQTQLAEKLYMTQRKISSIETGKSEPSVEDMEMLCKFYGVSADYLLGLPDDLPYPKRQRNFKRNHHIDK